MMNKKERLQKLRKDHYKYIKSLGVNIDVDTGEVQNDFTGYPMPDLSCRSTYPTSDRIVGPTKKKIYPQLDLPEGKCVTIAYNKGGYQLVDKEDLWE